MQFITEVQPYPSEAGTGEAEDKDVGAQLAKEGQAELPVSYRAPAVPPYTAHQDKDTSRGRMAMSRIPQT